jgi:hypothetical protein
MPHYEFVVIVGDGRRERQERYCGMEADMRAAWEHVYEIAQNCQETNAGIRVFDERGDIVIAIGAATAASLAKMRGDAIRLDPAA